MNSASLCRLAVQYDNPIPPRFLAHIGFKNSSSVTNDASEKVFIPFFIKIPGDMDAYKYRLCLHKVKKKLRFDRQFIY